MAQLDVTEMLLDPEFIDTLTLIHITTSVNEMGENVLVETPTSTFGSVQPASFKQIQRLPEAIREADVRSFYIKAQIITDGSGQYPDIIVFQGKRFEVQTAAPWLNYGSGWNEGVCVG